MALWVFTALHPCAVAGGEMTVPHAQVAELPPKLVAEQATEHPRYFQFCLRTSTTHEHCRDFCNKERKKQTYK